MTHILENLFDLEHDAISPNWLNRLQSDFNERSSEAEREQLSLSLNNERVKQFHKVLTGSEFASHYLCEHPAEWLHMLNQLDQQATFKDYREQFQKGLELDETEFERHLRRTRNRAMTRIIWRDFNRLSTIQVTTAELTALAEAAIDCSLQYHYPRLCQELGTPVNSSGEAQPLLVIGMGKLGAWELNLSSDVDLIFAFPHSGETCIDDLPNVRKSLSNQEFFTRLGQRIIKSLDQNTQDGFVFRVDMRLRPYGQSGALVSNFDSLEDYYQTQGREWERFAMIKARVIAHNGKAAHAEKLMAMLRSFTYRGYVDFSAIDALRNLKQLINREIKKRGLENNVKLGRGGIREIEFIAQAFQIIRGGRDTELQDRRVLHILPLLSELNCLPEGAEQELTEAYIFLRNLEHAIQGYQDKQTQQLPSDFAVLERIACTMGEDSWESCSQKLEQHRTHVHQHFKEVIADPDEQQNAAGEDINHWQDLWRQLESHKLQADFVAQLGFDDDEKASKALLEFLNTPNVIAMHSVGRERLDQLMPHLFKALSQSPAPSETLLRLTRLLKSVARRSAYLLLLIENPGALNQLVTLSQASPWIADRLTEHPALLDELLNPATLYSIPNKSDLEHELRRHVLRIDEQDLENQMEALRYFRSAHALQVAACEITERLPLMKVSDYLTDLAEVILEYVLHIAWLQLVARHGYPSGDQTSGPKFLIVGYGKLGGIELAHGSDLDLVFIHDEDPNGNTSGDADGKRIIDNATFYMRLGQKIIHLLDTQTPSGKLYEVDMRLRPSGNSGMLVASFKAYDKYQHDSAWTWEHQALVRARAIAGSPELTKKFKALRHEILTQQREPEKLRNDVVEMRNKMRQQLGSSASQQQEGRFHLKQDSGGIVDIEFMVQYGVLAWAHSEPALTEYPDNIRILDALLATGQINAQEVSQLVEAYKAFRSIGHRLALQQQPGVIDGSSVETERQNVTRIWQKLFGAP